MASPFPGIDPYIKDPEIWSDFHGDLAAEIHARLIIPLPLLEPDPDAGLDLNGAVTSICERGAYARLTDVRQVPPPPPLSTQDKSWLQVRLQAAGLRQ
jgi:hypothetical protein